MGWRRGIVMATNSNKSAHVNDLSTKSDDIRDWMVPKLKAFLTDHGLPVTGKKDDLVARVLQNFIPSLCSVTNLDKGRPRAVSSPSVKSGGSKAEERQVPPSDIQSIKPVVKIPDTCDDMSSKKFMKCTVGQLKEYLKQRLVSVANYNKAQLAEKGISGLGVESWG